MSDPSVSLTSAYNLNIPCTDGAVLLYNSNTGAVLHLAARDAMALAELLCVPGTVMLGETLPTETFAQLGAGGFLIAAERDELAEIRERYWQGRAGTPMVLTLTTTLDCNLGCYYCYEERSKNHLEVRDVESIVALARERLIAAGKRSLHIDWYGGEPLMNLEFMEAASTALQAMCLQNDIAYAASVISNGTQWPDEVGVFVKRHKIRQVQISFDGLRTHHDQRRRYRRDYLPETGASSFDRAVALVDRLLDHARVDVRINIDKANQEDVLPFVHFAHERGWFGRAFPAVIQPARLASYSERSSFMRRQELSLDEYDAIRDAVRREVDGRTLIEESEVPDGFPYPKTSVCAALATASVVIGADKQHYRCGLQVSEPQRAVGSLSDAEVEVGDSVWWEQFDPTCLPSCSQCSFLPICWGGCPKKHLEGDTHAIAEQSAYWRNNLPR
ncbi:MAG: radical SAM protein, partial [Anaerolineae bacterium]|nr:radical SAM protein [Gloeobacterales cyanobacterium ES-bin-313]